MDNDALRSIIGGSARMNGYLSRQKAMCNFIVWRFGIDLWSSENIFNIRLSWVHSRV